MIAQEASGRLWLFNADNTNMLFLNGTGFEVGSWYVDHKFNYTSDVIRYSKGVDDEKDTWWIRQETPKLISILYGEE